jgi:lipopolysaccharide/colanic/teichoic acid biosynthesis glycosyltransferase
VTLRAITPREAQSGNRGAATTQRLQRSKKAPRRLLTPLLLVVSDVVAVVLAFFAAWYLRYQLQVGGDVESFDFVSYEVYLPLAATLSGLVVVIFFFGSLYRTEHATFWFNDIFAIFGRCGFAVMALFAFSTMVRYPASSRLTFVLTWLLATLFSVTGRLLVQTTAGFLHRRGVGTERVVVVGDNSLGRMVMQGIAAQPHLGYVVVGFLGEQRVDDFGRFRYLGPVEKIDEVCEEFGIDQVIIALPSASHELQLRIDSRGPVIYKQTRIGKHGRPFTIYKFRSMRVGAEKELAELLPLNEQDGPIFKKRDDPRMTRVGRWIRRASLDELPQLFNVLKGDMSLVGPRPPLPSEVEQYEEWHLKRLQAAPGLTGLWQVSGRSGLNFEEMVVFDLAYIQNWSLSLDLSILLRTLPAVVSGGGAY